MSYPEFIKSFHSLDLPFPEDVVQNHVVKSDRGMVVFFNFLKKMDLPPHSHKDQWGSVIAGKIIFTIGDDTREYGPGDSYFIPAGTVHSAHITAGTMVMDVFEEPDRYPIKS